MSKRAGLFIEILLLFIGTPLVLISPIPLYVKLITAGIGVTYVIWISVKRNLFTKEVLIGLPKAGWLVISIKFITLVLISTVLMYIFNKENLFIVIKEDFLLWLTISLFYSIFSVYPQEVLYRTFFFKRYQPLFKSEVIFIIVNACLFSFAHIIFMNEFVILLTLTGGFAFAWTYRKSDSLLLTSIEHALYGSWIFTLGMGEFLAFPMPG